MHFVVLTLLNNFSAVKLQYFPPKCRRADVEYGGECGEMLMRILPSIIEMIYGGSCPMCHFLFSFPRARAVSRQVSECIPVMVTMEL